MSTAELPAEPLPASPSPAARPTPSEHRLVLTPRHLEAIRLHGEQAYPEECCGFLVGHPPERGDGGTTLVTRVLPARNSRSESRENRFLIDPETVLAAHKEARALDLEVVGYYHSHPDHPAEPSDFDRQHAWPGQSYVIVAVASGKAGAVRSWRLEDDRGAFFEERLEAPGAAVKAAGKAGPRA